MRLEGIALHAGVPVAATLVSGPGPIRFVQGGREAALHRLRVARADLGVALAGDGVRVDQVEHLLAALGGLGIRHGLRVEVDGPELPLLDGGARRWVDALLEIRGSCAGDLGGATHDTEPGPRYEVARSAEIASGDSIYRFVPGADPDITVTIAFDHPLITADRASWRGDPRDFAERIAPARTFGFARDYPAMLAAGRARGVDPTAVIVFTDDGGVASGGPRPEPDEPARHKLLDLIGDFAVYGGPFAGSVSAFRPGHRATHAIVAEALRNGVLRPGRRRADTGALGDGGIC